jgi:hypothetical protein
MLFLTTVTIAELSEAIAVGADAVLGAVGEQSIVILVTLFMPAFEV